MMRTLPQIAKNERIYAVGDVHGCFGLLTALIARIRVDAELRPARRTRILFVGDLVDRGPDSHGVVTWLQNSTRKHSELIVLRGNHEQIMIQALGGDEDSFEAWRRFGGDQTLLSWGVKPDDFERGLQHLMAAARDAVPLGVRGWLETLPLWYRSRDFLFVHAGIRPGLPLKRQSPDDLLSIRNDFLLSEEDHEAVIVHGHSVTERGPEILRNRVNLDTGAYRTGRLSAVGFEGARQWSISVGGEPSLPEDVAAASPRAA